MAVATLVELAIEIANAPVDPGARASRHRLPQPSITASKSRSTTTVKRPERTVRASRLGNMKPVERNDSAPFRLDPVEGRVLRAFRHGKDAAGIGLQQHFGCDVDEGGFAARHVSRLAGGGQRAFKGIARLGRVPFSKRPRSGRR